MGSFMSSALDANMKKQQQFMVENQTVMLERNMNMQNAMRERMMATQIARTRELLKWSASFWALASLGCTIRAIKTHNPAFLAPILPISFVVGMRFFIYNEWTPSPILVEK